jgi:hypothetical protein
VLLSQEAQLRDHLAGPLGGKGKTAPELCVLLFERCEALV